MYFSFAGTSLRTPKCFDAKFIDRPEVVGVLLACRLRRGYVGQNLLIPQSLYNAQVSAIDLPIAPKACGLGTRHVARIMLTCPCSMYLSHSS